MLGAGGRHDRTVPGGVRLWSREFGESGFGSAWCALTAAFALHVLDEATTGFLHVYNPTVSAMRARWGWFPMPTFEFRQWLIGLSVAVLFCFALTPVATCGPWPGFMPFSGS